eukprot:scaffold5260_cov101-Cylindrotheca_fusiformis.AAC.2
MADGKFYEAVPWANGFMDWNVISTWGYWNLTGRSTIGDTPFDVEVTYECDPERFPGLVFRRELLHQTKNGTGPSLCVSILQSLTRLKAIKLVWHFISNISVLALLGGPWCSPWVKRSQLKPAISVHCCESHSRSSICERKSMGNVTQRDT